MNRRLSLGLAVIVPVLILLVVTGLWNRWTERIRPFRLGETNAWYPHAAAKFMRQPGFPDRVFASQFGVASVYTYYNAPQGKVFMDGRLEVSSKGTFRKYLEASRKLSQGDPTWTQFAVDEAGRLPAVMLDTRFSRPLIMGIARIPGWRLVYADSAAAIFFEEGIADRLKLPEADPKPLIVPPEY